MRSKLVAGNWKMHGDFARNTALLGELAAVDTSAAQMVVIPPFPYLTQCRDFLAAGHVGLGAQDVSEYASGAYTGEVSASMLSDVGCGYVLVGHSERRSMHGESDDLVARKAVAACGGGLIPIICVGESLQERESGQTRSVVERQLGAVIAIAGLSVLRKSVVAYEPVWAIGTGRTATPEQAQDVHAFIRGLVASRDEECAASIGILYGGSVKASNAADLFAMPDVDGGLAGGASLVAQEFLEIHRAAVAAVR
jgi:triosephosphate isomerase